IKKRALRIRRERSSPQRELVHKRTFDIRRAWTKRRREDNTVQDNIGDHKAPSWKVLLDGIEVFPSKEIRRKMNYLSHHNALPEEMTVYDALRFYANMEGGNPDEVLDLLKLREQKNKVSIAKVFLREREIYLLDEPTANLDPIVSKEIRDILLELSRDKIVLYSSHNLYEARDVGTYLILIKEGSVALFDRISNIKSSKYRVGIRANTDISKIVDAKVGE